MNATSWKTKNRGKLIRIYNNATYTVNIMPTKQSTNAILAPERKKTAPPRMYKVILFNDDFTTMEFVIEVLQRFFAIKHERAMQIMLKVHNEGSAICGIYVRDVAETKVNQVIKFAKQHGHPLRCDMEEN